MKHPDLLVEFIGTFSLVLIGAGAAAAGHGGVLGAALAHGLVVMGVIYCFGNHSGAHINPAVTFAFLLSRRITWQKATLYMISQFLGSAAAAGLLLMLFGSIDNGLGATVLSPEISLLQGLVIEIVLTFLLVNAVFQAAVREKAGTLAGVVVGGTLIGLILFGGPLTGASLNPARTLGPALLTRTMGTYWLYFLGPLSGAGAAVVLDRVLHPAPVS